MSSFDPRTNIVSILPHGIQVDVIVQIVGHVVDNLSYYQSALITEEHCKWMMEVIGAGLKLPIEHFDTIEKCFNIYEFAGKCNCPSNIQKLDYHKTIYTTPNTTEVPNV